MLVFREYCQDSLQPPPSTAVACARVKARLHSHAQDLRWALLANELCERVPCQLSLSQGIFGGIYNVNETMSRTNGHKYANLLTRSFINEPLNTETMYAIRVFHS